MKELAAKFLEDLIQFLKNEEQIKLVQIFVSDNSELYRTRETYKQFITRFNSIEWKLKGVYDGGVLDIWAGDHYIDIVR